MSRPALAKLLTVYILDQLRDRHPDLSLLHRLGIAEAAVTRMVSEQPDPVPEDVANRVMMLMNGASWEI